MAEKWNRDARNEAKTEAHNLSEAKKALGRLKEEHAKLSEELRKAIRQRDSADAGLKTAERQAKDQRKQLHLTEINLTTERQFVKDLHAEL